MVLVETPEDVEELKKFVSLAEQSSAAVQSVQVG
jgi:hypothetical protein